MFSETHSGITSKQLQVTTVFKQEDRCPECGPNQVTYRIPALIYINENQTCIAFAEKRKTPNDTDADVLVMRRGMWNDGQVEVKLATCLFIYFANISIGLHGICIFNFSGIILTQ